MTRRQWTADELRRQINKRTTDEQDNRDTA